MSNTPILIISQHIPTINYLTNLLEELDYQVESSAFFYFDLLAKKNIQLVLFPIANQRIYSIQLLQKIHALYQVPYLLLTTSISPFLLKQLKQLPAPIYCAKMGNKDSLYIYLELVKYQNNLAT